MLRIIITDYYYCQDARLPPSLSLPAHAHASVDVRASLFLPPTEAVAQEQRPAGPLILLPAFPPPFFWVPSLSHTTMPSSRQMLSLLDPIPSQGENQEKDRIGLEDGGRRSGRISDQYRISLAIPPSPVQLSVAELASTAERFHRPYL